MLSKHAVPWRFLPVAQQLSQGYDAVKHAAFLAQELATTTGATGAGVGGGVGWSIVGIGVVGHTAIWHWKELGTHGCPSRKQKAASTDDSTPCTTIVHVAVDVAVPSPHVAVQDDCSRCTNHPTAADTNGLRWVRRTGLTLHA